MTTREDDTPTDLSCREHQGQLAGFWRQVCYLRGDDDIFVYRLYHHHLSVETLLHVWMRVIDEDWICRFVLQKLSHQICIIHVMVVT